MFCCKRRCVNEAMPNSSYCEKHKPSAASSSYLVIVILSQGLDAHTIEHIQLVEKQIDAALLLCGYSQSETSKAGSLCWYKQSGLLRG